MKIRTAAPILLASASAMAWGLGIASAQEQPEQPEQPQLPAQTQDRLRPVLKQLGRQQVGQRPAPAPGGTPPPGGTPAPGGTPRGTGPATDPTFRPGNVQEFDTGIDYRPTPPGARVTFNLEDADLPDLVRLISSITGKRFILPGKARSIKASVYAPTKVTAAEAYQAFLSILQLNGMTVVPSGRYLKIVESQNIENQPIPTYTGGSATPGDDRFLTRMHRVENVSAEDVANLLSHFKSPEGQVTAYAPTNTVIITDMGSNIQRMLRVIEAIDVPRGGEQVWIEPIHYVNATELASLLTEIFPVGAPGGGGSDTGGRPTPPRRGQPRTPTPAGGESAGGLAATIGSRNGAIRITKILPDERSNSLIIMATERAYLRILELIRQLDVPLEGEGGSTSTTCSTATRRRSQPRSPASSGRAAAGARARTREAVRKARRLRRRRRAVAAPSSKATYA